MKKNKVKTNGKKNWPLSPEILSVTKDKIILYITHNEKVKSLFSKKFLVTKGLITHQ